MAMLEYPDYTPYNGWLPMETKDSLDRKRAEHDAGMAYLAELRAY